MSAITHVFAAFQTGPAAISISTGDSLFRSAPIRVSIPLPGGRISGEMTVAEAGKLIAGLHAAIKAASDDGTTPPQAAPATGCFGQWRGA